MSKIVNQNSSEIKSGFKVTIIGMIVNIILVVFKLWVGIVGRSQALVADGVHSLSDLFSDVVVLFGIKWGRKGPDEDHPFGHRRIETVAGMVIGIILIAVGIGIVYNAFHSLSAHDGSVPSIMVLVVAGISIVLKELTYWITISVGKKINSLVVIGNAWHHRSDALSSFAVLLGAGAVYVNPKWYLADSLAAIIVSVFIMKVGVELIWNALKEVVDTAPDKTVLELLETRAENVEGVRQAHDIFARYSGSKIIVEIHIVVDPDLTVREGHKIAKKVELGLLEDIEGVIKVIVHVDPEIKKK